jgi:hypothetical protein
MLALVIFLSVITVSVFPEPNRAYWMFFPYLESLLSALSSSSEFEPGLSFGSKVRASSALLRCRLQIIGVVDEVVDGSDPTQAIQSHYSTNLNPRRLRSGICNP